LLQKKLDVWPETKSAFTLIINPLLKLKQKKKHEIYLEPRSQMIQRRLIFKLALMAYRVLNGMAPSYLNQLVPVSSLTGRRRLRSSFTLQLLVPSYRLSTVGRRSFPVAASMFWNTLPDDIQSAPSVSAFRRLLKTFLFQHSFPDVIL